MTSLRLLLLLQAVLQASGRVNPRQRTAKLEARRSSSSSSLVSSGSSSSNVSSSNRARPLSPTAARVTRKLRAPPEMCLESHFRLLLLLLLLLVVSVKEIRLQNNRQTRRAESRFQRIPTSPPVPTIEASN